MSGFADFDGKSQPDAPGRRAADAAMQLVSGADAIIIDLRDNGGGSPAMVGYLASYFVPKCADIYNSFKSRGPDASGAPTVEVARLRFESQDGNVTGLILLSPDASEARFAQATPAA
jgi:C-terminal processing protease CtpA/Prc